MSPTKHLSCVTLVAALLLALWVSMGIPIASAQNQNAGTRWEYAYFKINNGKAILVQAARELEVNNPLGSRLNTTTPGGRTGSQYTTTIREKENHNIGALNLFGSDGWEVVSASSTDAGVVMLMKPPY